MIPTQHLTLLKEFVEMCENNMSIIHEPELKFFADYLKSLGATLPAKKPEPTPSHDFAEKAREAKEESEVEESDLELDIENSVASDADLNLTMGDENFEVTEDLLEKSNDKRSEAAAAFSEGNNAKALEAYTEAIKLNPGAAALHAKRANVLLKMQKPNNAIKDCNKALTINPDSAQAFKFRGRAYMLLANFEQAHKDLATACKIDYDEDANIWLKETEPNYKKIMEHKRKHERKIEKNTEKKLNERRQKAQEAYEKAKHEAKSCCDDEDCDEGGMGAMGGLPEFFKDPEMMTAFQDPEVMKAFADVSQNPMNMLKYQDNPKVKKVLEKLATKMGGAGAGGIPGAFFHQATGQAKPNSTEPKVKPDIDID